MGTTGIPCAARSSWGCILMGESKGLSCGVEGLLAGRISSMLVTRPHEAGRLCGTGVAGRTVVWLVGVQPYIISAYSGPVWWSWAWWPTVAS